MMLFWMDLRAEWTINDIHESNHFACIKKYDAEKTFAAYSKQLKGSCNKYGKKGQKCQLPNKGKNKDTKKTWFQGKCWYCSIDGNKVEKCKKLKEEIWAKELEIAEYAANTIGNDEVELAF